MDVRKVDKTSKLLKEGKQCYSTRAGCVAVLEPLCGCPFLCVGGLGNKHRYFDLDTPPSTGNHPTGALIGCFEGFLIGASPISRLTRQSQANTA